MGAFKATADNDQPLYADGDFNSERVPDFSVVLLDKSIGAMLRSYRGNPARRAG